MVSEKARLLSLNDYIRDVGGYDPYVYEDMVEETDILFAAILDALPDTDKAIQIVVEAFNDDGASNAIIYHLRLLTASYLKGNIEKYAGFIVHDNGVLGYCQEFIERPNCEIDHLRVEPLASVLLKPCDVVLEIAYLDRSDNDAVSVYSFPDTNIGRPDETINMRMSLLFRPDHYDILYRVRKPSAAAADAVLKRYAVPATDTEPAGQQVDLPANAVSAKPLPSLLNQESKMYLKGTALSAAPALPLFDDTPDLTPGSSSQSPALMESKEEPLTPALISPASAAADPGMVQAHEFGAEPASAVSPPPTAAPAASVLPEGEMATRAVPSVVSPSLQQLGPSPSSSIRDIQSHHVIMPNVDFPYTGADYSGRTAVIFNQLPGLFRRDFGLGVSRPFNAPAPQTFNTTNIFSSPPAEVARSPAMAPPAPAGQATSSAFDAIGGMPPHSTSMTDYHQPTQAPASLGEPHFGTLGAYAEPMDVTPQNAPIPAAPAAQPLSQGNGSGLGGTTVSSGSTGSTFVPEDPQSHPVRFTRWHFERRPPEAEGRSLEPSTSRNSRFSTAYFGNPEFQPEVYKPSSSDSAGGKSGSTRGRKKNSQREGNGR